MKKHKQIPRFVYLVLGAKMDFLLSSDLRWQLWTNSMEITPAYVEHTLWISLLFKNPCTK